MNEHISKRLTSRWTTTAEEAYGNTGKQGRSGELWLAAFLRNKNYNVEDCESSKENQLKGVDLTISGNSLFRSYTIDVKTNLQNDGTFFIETNERGWLFNPNKTSDCIWHVNPDTKNMIWYSRKKMKNAINLLKTDLTFKQFFNSNNLLKLNLYNLPEVMSFAKTNINNKQADKTQVST